MGSIPGNKGFPQAPYARSPARLLDDRVHGHPCSPDAGPKLNVTLIPRVVHHADGVAPHRLDLGVKHQLDAVAGEDLARVLADAPVVCRQPDRVSPVRSLKFEGFSAVDPGMSLSPALQNAVGEAQEQTQKTFGDPA